jgi:hypothetical protein
MLFLASFGAFLGCRRGGRGACGLGLGLLLGIATATRGGFAVAGGGGGGHGDRSVCGFAHSSNIVFVCWLQWYAVRMPFRKRHATRVFRGEKEGKALRCNQMQRRGGIAAGLREFATWQFSKANCEFSSFLTSLPASFPPSFQSGRQKP